MAIQENSRRSNHGEESSVDRQIKLSVLIASYNTGQFLEETLETVVNQTYSNWEVVFMDGGSTDSTMDIIRRYAERYPNIRIYQEPDNGPVHAFQKAAERATGKFVYTLPISDGYLDRRWLERSVSAFTRDGQIALVWGIPVDIDDDHRLLRPHFAYSQFLKSRDLPRKRAVLRKAIGYLVDLLSPKTTLASIRKLRGENIVLAQRMLSREEPPQREDWFRYWLETGLQFPDANMCVERSVFLKCIGRDRSKAQPEENFMDFHFNFNKAGYLARCIPIAASFSRVHEGRRHEVHRAYNDRCRLAYLDKVRSLRQELRKDIDKHTFIDRDGKPIGKLERL